MLATPSGTGEPVQPCKSGCGQPVRFDLRSGRWVHIDTDDKTCAPPKTAS